MDYTKLREEPLKSAVQQDYFRAYRYTQLGNIDFVIAKHNTEQGQRSLFENDESDSTKSVLWAEAKQGTSHDIYESFVQLILTIGKERTHEKYLPPKYIGAFDAEKFAFIEYHKIQHIFYQNDFNWNVTPSNHDSKEFRLLHSLCENLLAENSILFRYQSQSAELKEFIKLNFKTDKDISEKISVTKNNFTFVFQKWSDVVKPTIGVDWEKAKKAGIIAADFFLADLLSSRNESLKDNLYVVLRTTKYELAKKIDEMGLISTSTVGFTDRQRAHKQFWSIYERPPKEEYWGYIIERRDLLVPQDIRERKGSFFTPQIWVEKSQQYLADVLGDGWQDEYYIWDCCAGTGNLLNGLTNYRNVWASTLDKQDVDVMTDRIANGWNMFENHVFQFDFLNDEFTKCPEELREILTDEQKRKKLVIYINPPYAEVSSIGTKGKAGVNQSKIHDKYMDIFGTAGRELFVQFLWRCYSEINGCIIAEFSKLKVLQGAAFAQFRENYKAKLLKMFVVPAWTFDNVKGNFPIGFKIWNTGIHEKFKSTVSNVFDENGDNQPQKEFFYAEKSEIINKWISSHRDDSNEKGRVGFLCGTNGSDFQQNGILYILNRKEQMANPRGLWITKNNIIQCAVYLSVRLSVESTWLNDRDQFLFPCDGWQTDREFQGDCLIYTLFHGQNRISSEHGTNHWIPFTERQVGCKKAFKSTFMSDFLRDFLAGKVDVSLATHGQSPMSQQDNDLFATVGVKGATPLAVPGSGEGLGGEKPSLPSRGCLPSQKTGGLGEHPQNNGAEGHSPQNLSAEAGSVYDAALELWKYYHAQDGANPDASFYDIRRHFQGTDERGRGKARMNNDSNDAHYTELIGDLRQKQKRLAKKIEAGVYKYGFLK